MQFDKNHIRQLAEKARLGPQKRITVDLKRVKKEATFLQQKYLEARREGPVSSFDFLLKWEQAPETKYMCTKVRSLAKIISQGQFNKQKFEFMMNMGKMVESGRIREYEASVAVGQRFANEYVAPAVLEQRRSEAAAAASSDAQEAPGDPQAASGDPPAASSDDPVVPSDDPVPGHHASRSLPAPKETSDGK